MAATAEAIDTMTAIPVSNATSASHVFVTDVGTQTLNAVRSFMLIGPLHDKWTLRYPLELTLKVDEDNRVIVSDDVFLLYGHGTSLQKAIKDYVAVLLEYHELLAARFGRGDEAIDPAYHRLSEMLVRE